MRRPKLILTVDPDSVRSAYALAVWDADCDGYRYVHSAGGGTSKAEPTVAWQTIVGQLELMRELLERYGVEPCEALAVIESQDTGGTWSGSVEDLRRVRFHFEAACQLLGIPCKFVGIAWAARFVPGAKARGKGKQKQAYKLKAQELTRGETTNEDRCAAFGILAVEIAGKKCELCID